MDPMTGDVAGFVSNLMHRSSMKNGYICLTVTQSVFSVRKVPFCTCKPDPKYLYKDLALKLYIKSNSVILHDSFYPTESQKPSPSLLRPLDATIIP